MGGQTATPDGTQLDMRDFHGVVALDTVARTVTVRSGTRWRELQQVLDQHGLAVKIMQTYNTFTVGGALSVNAHGRYIGQGPLVRSVREITMVLADGSVVTASPTKNPDLFYGAIGGYGALGVIALRHARRRGELARAARRREDPGRRLPRVLPQARARRLDGRLPQRRHLPAGVRERAPRLVPEDERLR